MDNLLILLIISLITEAVWETLKMTWQDGKFSIDRIGALIVGLVVAFTANVDILQLVGINVTIPIMGIVLTGILISRGANFVHDLYNKIGNPQSIVPEIVEDIYKESNPNK